jgi:hypothetical protein
MRKSCVHLSFLPFPSSSTYVSLTTVGHIAENCTSQERLCYNCRKPGHESSACTEQRSFAGKQCYSCGGVGHIQAECPTLRLQGSNQKCYVRALSTMEEMLSGCVIIFLDGFIYRIAAILDISRACVPTKRCKTLVLRRARLPLVAD